jgi:hypothetical protein
LHVAHQRLLFGPNGLELCCPAARAMARSFSRVLAGKAQSNIAHASGVSLTAPSGRMPLSQREQQI